MTFARSGRLVDVLQWLPVLLAAYAVYAWRIDVNPPGFYLDEASQSYNALMIARTGTDEHGVAWPIFFQSWDRTATGNPVNEYVMALVFWVFGPSILTARLLSVTAGFVLSLGLGILAGQVTGNRWAAWIVAGTALLTPWLLEVGRLVFEVVFFPLILTGFLTLLRRVYAKPTWSLLEMGGLALLLGLLTYAYTIGRFLGPLIAFGLILFASRSRARSIFVTWVLYGVTLLPALAFNLANPGVLGARADLLSYIKPGMSVVDVGAQFVYHLLGNLSLQRILLTGDPNLRHHVPVMGSLLAATLVLALAGLDRVLHGGWRDPWLRFAGYGLLVSLIPASLTIDEFHTNRLIAFPVFLMIFVAVGIARLATRSRETRAVLIGLVIVTAVQGLLFQVQFQRYGPDRGGAFDAAFPGVFQAALAEESWPIYLRDRGELPGYIEAYWYGALRGIDRSSFVRLRADELPPSGAVVIGTDKNCGVCDVIREEGDYIAYRAGGGAQTGLIHNGDFEAVGDSTLDTPGAPIFGWSSSPDVMLRAGGGQTSGAHLVLRHTSEATSTKQTTSVLVPVSPDSTVGVEALVRPGEGTRSGGARPRPSVTIALTQVDAERQFVTWETVTAVLDGEPEWSSLSIEPTFLDPRTAFIGVSCYLEPGGSPGDDVDIDDIVVSSLP
jgi:4-amino-4-deoxy-L-arabinose transferase-like glycosyltransferase